MNLSGSHKSSVTVNPANGEPVNLDCHKNGSKRSVLDLENVHKRKINYWIHEDSC